MQLTKKRFLSIMLSLAVMLSFIPVLGTTAYADDTVSYLEKSWDSASKSVKVAKKSRTDCIKVVNNGNEYDGPIWGEEGKTTWYVLSESVNIPGRITAKGTVNLILCDGAKLINKRGITLSKNNTLNIYAQSEGSSVGTLWAGTENGTSQWKEDMGTVWITPPGAGIGGKYDENDPKNSIKCGTVNIHGGNLAIFGGSNNAGIGGCGVYTEKGDDKDCTGDGGEVTIYGGTVNATGGSDGAGIGAGSADGDGDYDDNGSAVRCGKSGNVTIYSGTVNATGGAGGAGIGGGLNGDLGHWNGSNVYEPSKVIINGGIVTARGGDGGIGAGIGGGTSKLAHGGGSSGEVIINGGTVFATSGTTSEGKSSVGIGKTQSHGAVADNCDKLMLGDGVQLETSDDGSAWTGSTADTRKKYMRTLISYPLYVGGEQVTSANESDPGNRGWSYTAGNQTLTLKDCKIEKGYEFGSKKAAIYANQDLTIQLEGDSNVALEDWYGIYVDGSGNALTIKGDGALTVAGGTKAIEGSVKNEIPGTGWTDFAGKEGKTDIPVSTTGQDLTYKKAHFELVPAPEPSNTPAQESTTQKDQPKAAEEGDKVAVKDGSVTITSTDAKTASFSKAANKKSVTVPDTVKVDGKEYKVTTVTAKAFAGTKTTSVTLGKNITTLKPNAFKGSKVKKVTLKTKNLKKSSVKNSLKGSKVKTVKVKVGNKKTNKKYVKKYKKIFTKKNAGKKVKVS